MELALVVGVDGSDSSLTAVDWAVDEATRHGLGLRLVFASLWARYEGITPTGGLGRPSDEVFAEKVIGGAAERARSRNPAVTVSTVLRPEEPTEALLYESANAWAVVCGSRGRGEVAGLLLGSVGLTVAASAHCPVIVIRGERAAIDGAHGRVLLGVGENLAGADAVRFALGEARARGSELDTVRAWRCPAHESADEPRLAIDPAKHHEALAELSLDTALHGIVEEYPDVSVRRETVEGPARKVLVQRSAAADLVVVGARRRHGHFGLQLGRVGHTLLHHAACPVAVVPQRT
ncbi:universal stress protein [Streptomyces sp. NPDC050095]|uniref:universal stress protein n=1 Tax=unclassified Streptomyces TaxID=2593676 RepID=UPI00343A8692